MLEPPSCVASAAPMAKSNTSAVVLALLTVSAIVSAPGVSCVRLAAS